MIAALVGFTLSLGFLVIELITGFAWVGWTGDNMLVERAKSPGPYWFAIVLQAGMGIGLTLLLFLSTR